MKIKKNDTVKVISGEYKGKMGKVLRAFPKRGLLIVEGINFQKKHMRARSAQEPGGILHKEGPISVSNVMLICPKCRETVKVYITGVGDTRARKCKKCGEIID
ncbi:50S ribosomal protein L24 [candidate division WOR-3 bacterium JGI_Cruoil_03_44_89]|uniref:Large ribosomal subunit protein uL24 n=1 Tax=candidate division WOR-3 bacterium JGI_Cruoil_03_44_89 TaxID=1973748 RepID=A0A235BVD7_UNCW3|nr:MAG: 50S ribosomal protein L24 [candidate division WOR-3 bacterium JGI_Cruoil_03_44_89]